MLVAIPVTLFFVRQQQQIRSKAAPSSKLYFEPATTNTSLQCQNFTADLMIDPGENVVTIVHFYLTYDPTKVEIVGIEPSSNFQEVLTPASISNGTAEMSVTTGQDVSRYVQTVTKVATITFQPKATGDTQVLIDSSKSSIYNQTPGNEKGDAALNVLSSVLPANISVGNGACGSSTTLTPTGGVPSGTITATPPAGNDTPTVSPTIAAQNQSPVCTSLSVSPGATGSAPFSVLFTGQGNDPDTAGLITKGTFTFGDGATQDVTSGLNLQNVTVQASHTYSNVGSYSASLVFTDNNSGISTSCTQAISVGPGSGASGSATPTIATATPISSSAATATPIPTIPPTGNFAQTVGIVAAVLLTLIGGFVLLAL